jgi:tellurite resistance protein TehA-like permease
MTDASRDTPNVIIFPPLIPISVLVVGVVLNLFMPLGLLGQVLFLGRIVVGAIAFVVLKFQILLEAGIPFTRRSPLKQPL